MTASPSVEPAEPVTVSFAVEIAIEPPRESDDFDAVAFGGELVRDAIAGWGVAIVRIAHLSDPDAVFGGG